MLKRLLNLSRGESESYQCWQDGIVVSLLQQHLHVICAGWCRRVCTVVEEALHTIEVGLK